MFGILPVMTITVQPESTAVGRIRTQETVGKHLISLLAEMVSMPHLQFSAEVNCFDVLDIQGKTRRQPRLGSSPLLMDTTPCFRLFLHGLILTACAVVIRINTGKVPHDCFQREEDVVKLEVV